MKKVAFLALLVAAATALPASLGGAGTQPLKVRVITASPVTAGIWDPMHYAAYKGVADTQNWDLQIAQTVAFGQAPQVIDRWGQEGVDIVYATSSSYIDSFLGAASKYPKTIFVLMGQVPTLNNLPNMAAYSYNTCEFGFLQGAAGALVSKTHKIGVVMGLNILPAKRVLAGINFGSRKAVKGTQVLVKLTNTVLDATKNQEAASALLAQGADVIIATVNSVVSPQIASRVQDAGKFYIGSYADETKFAPKANVTNIVTDFLGGYRTVAAQVTGGSFKPGQYIKGIAHGWVKAQPFKPGVAGLTAAKAKELDLKLRSLAQKVARGQLKNPHCQAG